MEPLTAARSLAAAVPCAPRGELGLHDLVEEVFLHLGAEHFVREVELADLLALQIENIDFGMIVPPSVAT